MSEPTEPPAKELTDEERRILAETEPHWISDQEVRRIGALVLQGKLLATIDTHGAPFRYVRDVSLRRQADKLILWLDPQGLDDDLTTPMED